jgi:hypothetical protein
MIFLLTYDKERALVSADSKARARETMKCYGLRGTLTRIATPPLDVENLCCYPDRVIEDTAVNLQALRNAPLLPRSGRARLDT